MDNNEVLGGGTTAVIMKDLNVPMPAAPSEQFLRDTIVNATTLAKLPVQYKKAPAGNIDALAVGRRKLRLAGANDTPDGTGSISSRQIPYAVKKVKWDEWLQNDDVFYNMSARGEDVESTIVAMIQKQFGVDLQDLIFNGDTTSGDTFLNIVDGFVKRMKVSTNKTDLTTNDPTILDFINHIQLLPEKYKSFDDITWFITQTTHDKLVSLISSRTTGFGDTVLVDGKVARVAGYPVEIVATMQSGFAALTPLRNLVPILTRDLRYIRTGVGSTAAAKDATYHVLYAYLDCVLREVDAVAWMTGTKL